MNTLDKIAEFFYANPQGYSHLVDMPYRLSSGSLDNTNNFHIWESNGEIEAIGIIQRPWVALDYAYTPSAEHLVPAIFDWAIERSKTIATENNEDFTLAIRIGPSRKHHIQFALERNFGLDDDWTIVHLRRAFDSPLPKPDLPDGFSFYTLQGQTDVERYVNLHQTAFGSKIMQNHWRSDILKMPQYRSELDLFILNSEGQPVAFCIGWQHPNQSLGQIEPLGVHPDYHRLGLGRAILLEGLRKLQLNGVETAFIDTYKYNDPAYALYQSPNNGNFEIDYEATGYIRTFPIMSTTDKI